MKKPLITYTISLILLASFSVTSTGCAAIRAIGDGHTHQTKPEIKKENGRIIGEGIGGYISHIDFKEGIIKINPYTYQSQELYDVTRSTTYRPFNGWGVFTSAWSNLLVGAGSGWVLHQFWDNTKTGPPANERNEAAVLTAFVITASLIAIDLAANGALAIPIPKELARSKQITEVNQKQVQLKELTLHGSQYKWEKTIKVPEKGDFELKLKDFPVDFFENPNTVTFELSGFNRGALYVSQDQKERLYIYINNQLTLAKTLDLGYRKDYQKAAEIAEHVNNKYLTIEEADELSKELMQWRTNAYLHLEASYKKAKSIMDFNAVISNARTISTQSPYFNQAMALIKNAENQKQQLNILSSAIEQARQNNYISAYQQLRQVKNGVALDSAKQLLSTYQSKAREQELKAEKQFKTKQANDDINSAYSLASKKQFTDAISIASRIQKDSIHYSKAQRKIKEWEKLRQIANAHNAAQKRILDEQIDIQKNKLSVTIKGKNEGAGGKHDVTVVNNSNRAVEFTITVKSWANDLGVYFFQNKKSQYLDMCEIRLQMKPKEKRVVTCIYPKAKFFDRERKVVFSADFTKSYWDFITGVEINKLNNSSVSVWKNIEE